MTFEPEARAVVDESAKVPALTVVPPEYVLDPDPENVNVLRPDLTTEPVPMIAAVLPNVDEVDELNVSTFPPVAMFQELEETVIVPTEIFAPRVTVRAEPAAVPKPRKALSGRVALLTQLLKFEFPALSIVQILLLAARSQVNDAFVPSPDAPLPL